MRNLLIVLMALLLVVSCGEYKGQYDKIVSPEETVTIEVYCWTLIGIPVFCVRNSTSSITVKEVVEMAVEEIVKPDKQEEVPIAEIVEEVKEEFDEKSATIEEIAETVVDVVKDSVPTENQTDTPAAQVVEEIAEQIAEGIQTPVEDTTPIVSTQRNFDNRHTSKPSKFRAGPANTIDVNLYYKDVEGGEDNIYCFIQRGSAGGQNRLVSTIYDPAVHVVGSGDGEVRSWSFHKRVTGYAYPVDGYTAFNRNTGVGGEPRNVDTIQYWNGADSITIEKMDYCDQNGIVPTARWEVPIDWWHSHFYNDNQFRDHGHGDKDVPFEQGHTHP